MKNTIKNLALILARLLILGLIPLNMFVMNINELAAIVLTLAWLIAWNLLVRKMNGREKKKSGIGSVLFIGLDILILFLMIISTEFNFLWNSVAFREVDWSRDTGSAQISSSTALEDLDYALKYLKKIHPLTINGLPADVEQKAAEVRSRLKSCDSIPAYELSRELESIFSMFGDGHTHVDEKYAEPHYMKHNYEHKKAGDTLIGINGIRFEDFLKTKPGYVSYEREAYGVRLLKTRASTLEGLRYLEIDISGRITYNYETKEGEYIEESVTAADFLTYDEYIAYEESVTGEDLHSEDSSDFVRYEIDDADSLAILYLDSCSYNSHYKEVVRAMFEEVAAKDIQNVAVDLRYNSGGSSLVADEFISYLDVDSYRDWSDTMRVGCFMIENQARTKTNHKKGAGFSGNVYVITSVNSYSSAMDFAMYIQDNGLGSIVGEASGNMPGSYGEVASFILPGSGLYMQISSKAWHRIDESREDQPILPDIECDPSEAIDLLKEML